MNVIRLRPELPLNFLSENDVTLERMSVLLDAAVVDACLDGDGELYVSDGLDFPAWIGIDSKSRLIKIFTYVDMKSLPAEACRLVNDLNRRFIFVQFNCFGPRLWGHFWMSYEGGMNTKQFVKNLRRFSNVFVTATEEFRAECQSQKEVLN